MGKISTIPSQSRTYRDNPVADDAASTSSAVLLNDIDGYEDEDLPAYTDEPANPSGSDSQASANRRVGRTAFHGYQAPPEIPFSNHDLFLNEVRTHFPDFSNNAMTLLRMIKSQMNYPPGYYVQLTGTHTEAKRQGNKESKDKVTDFFIRISIQHLIALHLGDGEMECLPNNKRGYRGGRIPSTEPTMAVDEENQGDELKAWCEAYVANSASVKSFTLKRKIIHHDTKKLEQLLRSAIAQTGYRGHLEVDFPTTHSRVIVYSPGNINKWRITTWIRWVFYLTFLWLVSWPVLFFLTHKYEVVKVIYSYADRPGDSAGDRTCKVMSEVKWFGMWESAIKRAALAKMLCKDRCLDDEYRIATARADERGIRIDANPTVPNTGNAFADAAFGVLGQGLRVAEGWNANRGWGYDC